MTDFPFKNQMAFCRGTAERKMIIFTDGFPVETFAPSLPDP